MDNDSNIKIEKKEKIVENKEKEPPIINKINNIKEVKENKDTREIINMMNKPNNLLKKKLIILILSIFLFPPIHRLVR